MDANWIPYQSLPCLGPCKPAHECRTNNKKRRVCARCKAFLTKMNLSKRELAETRLGGGVSVGEFLSEAE
jgi:hypothetical protein